MAERVLKDMPNANEVTNVTLVTTIRNPVSDIFGFKTVLKNGVGTLAREIQGGQQKFSLILNKGDELSPLYIGESVSVTGKQNGQAIDLPIALQVTKAHEPWKFTGQVGSTGP
jgi:hypothetical protein